jgi:protein-S-isoprenylcysteine O-methyltransferase Ste14
MSTLQRGSVAHGLVVALYALVFYGALPAGLWGLARLLDGALGWSLPPRPWAWALVAPAAALHLLALSNLWIKGGGAPITAVPPPRFTAAGLYGFVRHPIYFTYNLLLPGFGLALGSGALATALTLGFLPCWMLYATVEERFLVRRFGEPYLAYRRKVGLLPGLFKRA